MTERGRGFDRRRFLRLAGAAALGPVMGAGCRADPEDGRGASATGGADADAAEAPLRGTPGGGTTGGWPGYDDAIVIDGLGGPIQFNIPQQTLPLDEVALGHLRRSGITAVNLTTNERAGEGLSAYENTRATLEAWTQEAERHPDVLTTARSVADIRSAKASGRLGLVFGFQDAVPFEDDLSRLDEFYERGVRIIQLTYNVENRIGTGCLAPHDDGLTELGLEAVGRMDELGVLVDLSHCGPRTTRDGIEASSGPVAITHSGCKAIFNHPRSKDDDTLRRMAERGGVVGIYLMPFLNPEGPPDAADVIAHIEHALDVCGEDHVGIGSDQGIVPLDVSGDFPERFREVSAQRAAAGIAAPREDTIPYVPELNHPRRIETIASLMASRGHPSRVIEKVVGRNMMWLFEEVWS